MTEYTTKQIAELLGVSKPTVQTAINKLSIKPDRKENNNRAFYSYDNTVSIIKAVKPDFDFAVLSSIGDKSPNETEKPKNETPNMAKSTEKLQSLAQNGEKQTAKPKNNEELELLKKTISIIEEQLAEKDKQLEAKDKQIQALQDRLALALDEALQIAKGQQYITVADKTLEANRVSRSEAVPEEKQIVEPPRRKAEKPQKKKNLFDKMFRRRK